MLSIGAMSGNQSEYYTRLAQQDYYLSGGEPEGYWRGKGASAMRLGKLVKPRVLGRLFHGYSPSNKKLVQNAGKPNRQPGWDLTFSAPKSVSVLWSQADSKLRNNIQAAHRQAVDKTIEFIEERFAESRVGKGGTERVKAKLVVAAFEHSCSRALDPQLHTHSLVLNLGVCNDGKVRTITSKDLYRAKMLSGAFYRCELANQLISKCGLQLTRPLNNQNAKQAWFEVAGIPLDLVKHFSKRRTQILDSLKARGLETASAASFAALATRSAKDLVPPRI